MPKPTRVDGRATAPVLAALLFVSLALRPQLASIGPLSDRIIGDLGVSHAFVGLLTTIPILCMGLFAPVGPGLAARLGSRGAIALASGIVAVAGAIRAVAPGETAILALTFVIGVATAASGPLLAMYVRATLHEHRVAGTAAYAGGITLGQAIAAGVVVPLAIGLGGWRPSLAVVSVASAAGVVVWLAATRRDASGGGRPRVSGSSRLGLPVRRPLVWAIGLLLGVQSSVFYGTNAWLPSLFVERGWDPAAAALLLAASNVGGLAAVVLAPIASRRGVERRELLVGAATAAAVGIAGVIVAPVLAWVWSVVLGAGLGLLFTTVLTLPTDVAADAGEAGAASAMMLLVGYLIASAAPFALGAVRDMTGSFSISLWLLLGLAVCMLPLSWLLAPDRLRPSTRGPASHEAVAGS